MIPVSIALLLLVLASSFPASTTAFSGAPPLPSKSAKQKHGDDAIVVLQPDGSANSKLYNLLQSEDTTTNVVLEGYVSKRRALGSSLSFLDIIPWQQDQTISDDELASVAPVQAILRREFWDEKSSGGSFDVYHKVLQPGTKVRLQGTCGPSRVAREAMVFVSRAEYRLANANPQHLRNVLKFARDGLLDVDEVSNALPIVDREEFLQNVVESASQTCGELASTFLSKFPPKQLLNPSHLMGATNSQKVALLPPVPTEYLEPLSLSSSDGLQENSGEMLSVNEALEKVSINSIAIEPEILPCTIVGWVQNRRRYAENVTVLELVDNFSSLASMADVDVSDTNSDENATNDALEARNANLKGLWKNRIYCVLHPGALDDSEFGDQADIYGNILCSGARVALQGYLVEGKPKGKEDRNGSNVATFWVSNCRLLRSSWRPSVVRNILDLVAAGKFDVDEASESLDLPYNQVDDIANGGDKESSGTDRQWMAAEVSKSLQGENSRVGKICSNMRQSLETFASAREQYPIEAIETSISEVGEIGSKASQILDSTGAPLRTSPDGSRWQNKKKPQLEWMLGQINEVIRSHPEFGKRPLQLCDVGGGKGSLSNLLAETFGELVVVQVVDISQSAIRNGQMRAMRRGLGNIRYDAQDATKLDVSGVDVVVALHACGALSDVALGHASREGAGYVITPCCFRSNPQLRVGAETVDEWLDVESTTYESLKQLAELQGDISMSSRAMHSICGLRASAVQRKWKKSRWGPGIHLSTKIKSFPIGFSTRNLCLVGKFEAK